MAKKYIGKTVCPGCGENLVWRESETGSISAFCQLCDYQSVAKDGTPAKTALMKAMGFKPAADAKPSTPTEKPHSNPPDKPEPPKPAKKGGAFGPFGL